MKYLEKEQITTRTQEVLHSSIISQLSDGSLYGLLNLDIKGIIKRFNSGDYQVLYEEDTQTFIKIGIRSDDILNTIIQMKELVQQKDAILAKIKEKKDMMNYYPNETIILGEVNYYSKNCTYAEFIQAIELAEKILNDQRIYQLLNFLLKNESLINSINTRLKLLKTLEAKPEKTKELLEALKIEDDNIGIIRVNDNGQISIGAGTRKDMAISDLIGRPFKKDIDEPGHDYGPHGDYWMPPKKVTKTFHEQGETELHHKMISEERTKRRYLKEMAKSGNGYLLTGDPYYSIYCATPELGYILSGDYALLISKQELISYGIDPATIGWMPMALRPEPKTIFDIADRRRISIREIIGLKKDEILAKRR